MILPGILFRFQGGRQSKVFRVFYNNKQTKQKRLKTKKQKPRETKLSFDNGGPWPC